MAESDRQQGRLDEERATLMIKHISDLLLDVGERFEAEGKGEPTGPAVVPLCVPRIVCLPAARPADRVAASMVTQILAWKGLCLETVPEGATAGEKVQFVAESEADLIVISAVPPSSLIEVRYLYKRIRRLHPKVSIVIGLWNDSSDPEILRKRVAPDSNAHVVTTLTEAVDQMRRICQTMSYSQNRAVPRLQAVP